ncbi:hypothetical protein PLICRDRAFT_92927 [Plicaturopsis crispa FD-325 SS-3]|nr:hypothetical protein PLICRDRAFT_92927 [Plicaturopsis crispa FD-325 SS-3]
MDPAYSNRKVLDLSEAELISLEFLGKNALPEVKRFVERVQTFPDKLGGMFCSTVDHLRRSTLQAQQPPVPSDAETLYAALSSDPDAHTVVPPALLSRYEAAFWYHGISHRTLLWRSDTLTNPFPAPAPGTRFADLPAKTARGVFGTPLNAMWRDVAPRILAVLKARGLQCSALQTTRYATSGQVGLGPVVVWIAVRTGTASDAEVRDATPDVLRVLADVDVTDVVVEWIEASVQML